MDKRANDQGINTDMPVWFEFSVVEFPSFVKVSFFISFFLKFRIKSKSYERNIFIELAIPYPYSDIFVRFPEIVSQRLVLTCKLHKTPLGGVAKALFQKPPAISCVKCSQ